MPREAKRSLFVPRESAPGALTMRGKFFVRAALTAAIISGAATARVASAGSSVELGNGTALNIQSTVGSGSNTAYLAIDFSNNTPPGPAYAWQYDYNSTDASGSPTSEADMLTAVAAEDPELTVVDETYPGFIDNFNYGTNIGSAQAFAASDYSYWANYIGQYDSTDSTYATTQNVNWLFAPYGEDETTLGDLYDANGDVLGTGVQGLLYGWTINGEFQTTNLTPDLPISVPEPASFGLLVVVGVSLLIGRRRSPVRS
jgi:hypothetical protein